MDAVFEACPSLELFECDVGVKIDSRCVYFPKLSYGQLVD